MQIAMVVLQGRNGAVQTAGRSEPMFIIEAIFEFIAEVIGWKKLIGLVLLLLAIMFIIYFVRSG